MSIYVSLPLCALELKFLDSSANKRSLAKGPEFEVDSKSMIINIKEQYSARDPMFPKNILKLCRVWSGCRAWYLP